LKKRYLKERDRGKPSIMQMNYLEISQFHNYFRHWKKQTTIEMKKYKLRKGKELLQKITDNIYFVKFEAMFKWQ